MYRRRRVIKRRPFRRFKRRFRRVRTFRRGMGANSKRFFKLRQVVSITIQANQNFSFAITDNPSLSQDWVPVSDLFQLYRTNGIKFTFIPSATQSTFGSPTNFNPIYLIHDTNGTLTAPFTENEMLQFENLKIRQMGSMWSQFWRMKRRINPTAGTSLSTSGYSSVTQPQVTQNIRIFIPGIAQVQNPNIGRLVVTYYVSAMSRN